MHPFRVEPIPTAFAERVRRDRADGYGNTNLQPIHVDESPGICRHCLRDAAVGESVYLVSYSPFVEPRPYRSLGPIFIHASDCPAYDATSELPASLDHRLISARAYRADDFMVVADVASGRDVGALLERFLDRPEVAYVDLHNARPGCFNCRVRRA